MRIGEVLQTTRSSLVLPEDMLNSQHYILVSIREPKTRNRGPRHQAAKIEAQDLVMIIIMAFRGLRGDQKLWPMSPQTLRKRLDQAPHRVGAAPGPRGARPIDQGPSELEVQPFFFSAQRTQSWSDDEASGPRQKSWRFTCKKFRQRCSCPRCHESKNTGLPRSLQGSVAYSSKRGRGHAKASNGTFGTACGPRMIYTRQESMGSTGHSAFLADEIFRPRRVQTPPDGKGAPSH